MAAFLALSYLAFCIPALLAGVSIKTAGLVTTTNVYGGVVVLLAVSALAGLLIQQAGRARAA